MPHRSQAYDKGDTNVRVVLDRQGRIVRFDKPVDVEQSMASVGELGLYWLVLDEPPPGNGRRYDAT